MMTKKVVKTSSFKKDYKRELKTDSNIDSLLVPVFTALMSGAKLDEKYRDHALTGNWKPYRECHIKPDLLLVYDYPDDETLMLVRLGSHSELKL